MFKKQSQPTLIQGFLYFLGRRYIALNVWRSPCLRSIHKYLFNLVYKFKSDFSCLSFKTALDGNVMASYCYHNLFKNGYCQLDPFDACNLISLHQLVVAKAQSLLFNHSNTIAGSSKSYLKMMQVLPLADAHLFYKYFTSDFFINLVGYYLNDKPLLTELKILVSPISVPDDKPYEGSQLFHTDFDDQSNVKVFVFLDDVDSNSGPLQALNRDLTSRIIDTSGYRQTGKSVTHSDDILPASMSHAIQTFVGPVGSIVLIDTDACFHRGSRSCSKERRVLYATYNKRTSFRFPPLNWIGLAPKLNTYSSPLIRLDPTLSFLNAHALNF